MVRIPYVAQDHCSLLRIPLRLHGFAMVVVRMDVGWTLSGQVQRPSVFTRRSIPPLPLAPLYEQVGEGQQRNTNEHASTM
jgi:hypothetical protein